MLSEKIRKLEKNGYQFYETRTFVVNRPLVNPTEEELLNHEYTVNFDGEISEELFDERGFIVHYKSIFIKTFKTTEQLIEFINEEYGELEE